MSFIKKVENFTCENCTASIEGDGFTNHCAQCLWSKHVDNDPGDRAAGCGGLMKPSAFEQEHDGMNVVHECRSCGHVKKNKLSLDDNIDVVAKIMRENSI